MIELLRNMMQHTSVFKDKIPTSTDLFRKLRTTEGILAVSDGTYRYKHRCSSCHHRALMSILTKYRWENIDAFHHSSSMFKVQTISHRWFWHHTSTYILKWRSNFKIGRYSHILLTDIFILTIKVLSIVKLKKPLSTKMWNCTCKF